MLLEFANNNFVGSTNNSPFLFSFTPVEINSIQTGQNTLKIVATDLVLNKTEVTGEFNVGE